MINRIEIATHLFVKWNQLGCFRQNSTENVTEKGTEKHLVYYQSHENAWVIGFAKGKSKMFFTDFIEAKYVLISKSAMGKIVNRHF